MAQFDVYRIAGHGLVVDCQSDLLSDLRSRVVAPLRDPDDPLVSASRLNPLVQVEGKPYRVAVQFTRAIDRSHLGDFICSLAAADFEIKLAIDFLISGY